MRKCAAAARQAGREPSEVTLVAATKVQTSDTIRQAIAAGVTICGENRVQEMTAHLDDDAYAGAALHFIGHLQTNKVRQVVGRVELIESVGSGAPAGGHRGPGRQAGAGTGHPAGGQHRRGGVQERHFPGGAVRPGRPGGWQPPCAPAGLMAIPPVAAGPDGKSAVFCKMCQLYVDIRSQMDDNKTSFDCLSMGMSGDFHGRGRREGPHWSGWVRPCSVPGRPCTKDGQIEEVTEMGIFR